MDIPITFLIRPGEGLLTRKNWPNDRPVLFIYRTTAPYDKSQDTVDTDEVRQQAQAAALRACVKLYEDKPEIFARKPSDVRDFIITSSFRGTPMFIRAPGDEDG